MRRLLCILSGMDTGGAETFLMKVYRVIDRTKYQMDFCINVKEKCFYEDEILSLGGKIYRIPTKSENVREFRRQLSQIVRENGYRYVLRITSNAAGFMDLKIAKKAGAEICIVRSSNSSDGGSMKSRVAHRIGRLLYDRYVDVKIAPSDLAAKYTFGRRAYERGEVRILHNGLDFGVFKYDETAREAIRQEFGIPSSAYVVGHVGRFEAQKNHAFLLDIFGAIREKRKDAFLLLVGEGSLMDEIKEKARSTGLSDHVIFAGRRADIPCLLSAVDVFVFPSFYEGMPNTVIEAQATGLPCVISDTITREADITGLVQYLSLADTARNWADTALECKNRNRSDNSVMKGRGYCIADTAASFISYAFKD